ncbi:hypothetical protein ElyMa_004061600 [Elysia marginata]|uniref:CUB domain-containing protein n=1 Tax=Elysia marginata TaxID=1093978 RepID=A0AAV4G7V7_9GAST|nr:hypothetical protein ElyMa_004061600 [Elysia marginata]
MIANVAVVFLLACAGVRCQNQGFNDIDNVNAASNLFFFDKNSDCNGPKRELYNAEATIRGSDIATTNRGPTSCEIILISQGQFQGTLLDIQVISMNIQDCGVQVSIYDGEGAQTKLRSYDCRSSQNQNMKRVVTSGNVATFIMTRENPESVVFDIEIRVRPIRGGNEPGWENNYNRDNPFAFDKFDQEAIVGMVGGFYGLVFLICCAVVIYWYRVFNGLNKEWETHQLATLKTEERFESRRLTAERDGVRPRYATTNFSYSNKEDDDPDHFEEKVITSRPRTINRRRETRSSRPPSYAEAVSDDASQQSSEEEYSSDASVGKKSLTSGEASSRSRSSRSSEAETSTHSESEGSDDGTGSESSSTRRRRRRGRERGARARRPPPAVKPHKSRGKTRRDSSNASETASNSTRLSRQQQQRRQQQQHPLPNAMGPMGHVPYGAPGQFVPVMAAPIQMMPGYPPPQYPPESQPESRPPPPNQVHPTDPPVYSYLVQRGYTPLDQRSAASHPSTRDSHRQDEPDTRLSSGVDYMRR